MIFTTSEFATYQSCRRRWDLTSHNRQSLARKGRAPTALAIGTLVHTGLEAHLDGDMQAHELASEAAEVMAFENEEAYKAMVGAPWSSQERKEVDGQNALATGMVEHHVAHYGDRPMGHLDVLVTECSATVPLGDTPHEIACTFDAICQDPQTGELWIVDHKTYSNEPKLNKLELGWQFRAYTYALESLFPGETVGGAVYNGLAKKLPKAPRLLKGDKGLSRAKATLNNTTHALYLDAIKQHSLEPADYAAELEQLAQAQSPFFRRYFIPKSASRQSAFLGDAQALAGEMATGPAILPTFSWQGCPGCPVRDLCEAKENCEVPPYQRYEKSAYTTTKALELSPTRLATVDDLRSL